ncbi:MAG: hypothetical protein WC760_03420 [Bacteroidia bacterium]|jgi:tetratricopeptide (TPR) repeat protein
MKFRKQNFNLFLIAVAFLVSACGIKTDMLKNNYTVTPNPLEMKGDSVSFTIVATIPPKSINPKANIQFNPYLKTASGEIPLHSMTIGGEAVQTRVDAKVNSKTGGKITYNEKIKYTDDMKRATLYPDFAVNVKGTYQAVPNAKGSSVLAEGTNVTALLVNNAAGSMAYDVTDYSSSTSSKMVNIYFPINVDRFNPSFKLKGLFENKKQLDSLKKVLKASKDWIVKGVTINAFASPDGELNRNDELAKGRSNSTYKYLKGELKKLGFTEANDQNFKVGYTLSEDWAGYGKNVEKSTHPDKAAVVAIINDKSINDDAREDKIKETYPAFWEATKNTLLPSLRKSELVVTGTTPLKTDEELLGYMEKLDQLTDVELLHLGTLQKDAVQRERIYTQLTTKYPEDWRGFNDLGAIQIELGKMADGTANIEKANTLSPENPTVMLNLANIARINNDFAKATEMYKSAAAKGADASYGLGIIAIKRGNYQDALNQLGKSAKNDFNYALAQLLNNDAAGAKTTIDNMKPESLTWDCYYLRAIAGARMGNQDEMTTNLTRAIEKNPAVRALAKDDVEFIKYWTNPAFQTAIR